MQESPHGKKVDQLREHFKSVITFFLSILSGPLSTESGVIIIRDFI